jgi:hypothetical protein
MIRCPHCGAVTFVGGGQCNHCTRDFAIARLDELFMQSADLDELGKRVVPIDDTRAYVVFAIQQKTKRGPGPVQLSLMQFRNPGDGWHHHTSYVYDAEPGAQVAEAILALTGGA